MDIVKIDKNFKIETKIEREGLVFFDADEAPFKIYGVYREGDHYVRMPRETAEKVSDGVKWIHTHTTGGRIRFITDSPYIAVRATINNSSKFSHFSATGIRGFDIYSDKRYFGTIIPPIDIVENFENVIDIPDAKEREYTINMPLYCGVKKVYIGIKEGCTLKPATDYKITKPIVYYGSSITQGGCVSRPGNAYPNIISRELNCDFINLGFSGSAKAEDEIAQYISGLDMSVFVYDYDHNAPTLQHYKETHERMFKIIRNAQPTLPIIMTTRPKYYLDDEEQHRINVMLNTYNNAVSAGDKNVYCIKGTELLLDEIVEYALVDNCHPNDCGFASIARVYSQKLGEILNLV